MENTEYICCFCEKPINKEITTLIVATDYGQPIEDRPSQHFFCHTACFQKTLANNVPFYLEKLKGE